MSDIEEQPQSPIEEVDDAQLDPQEDQIDIFGGDDSDLTDIEELDQPPLRRSASPSGAAHDREDSGRDRRSSSGSRSASPIDDGDDGEESDRDLYREDAVKRLPKIGKKKRSQGEMDVEGGEAAPRRKKAKSKRRDKSPALDDVDEAPLDPEAHRRRELARRIAEAARKPAATSRSKKRKAQDEEDLEMMNDEAVATLRGEMLRAADDDVEENNLGRPALHKLRMLPKVVDLMQKTALHETIAENGMLDAVKRWLEPLPDKSLPALNIQRPLISLLRTFTIETSALKSSELGKVIYFYTKCKRVDPAIARMAQQLVADWMRPILRRSKALVDRDLGSALLGGGGRAAAVLGRGAGTGTEQTAQATRHARIPQALTATYATAPGSRVTGQSTSLPGQGSGAKMRGFKQKMQNAQLAARRG